jgi:small-conductance mechanosensitive channel
MPFVLAQFGLGDQPWVDPAVAAAVVLVSMLVAAAVHLFVFPLAMRITNHTPTELDGILIRAARWPINAGIVVVGLYLSLTLTLDLPAAVQGFIDIAAQASGAMLLVVLFGRVVSRGIDWAIEEQEKRERSTVDPRLLLMLRRVLVGLIYCLGMLLLLNTLGIPISPLIAGLGLGGVAVALAIQPTLSNLFAGTYVMTEGVVSPGDYIEMEGGVSGYVLEVGWRSTRLRTWSNTLVVVPNARFAETIITNYQEPQPAVNVFLPCGVSYESDLRLVQQICQDVMDRLLETDPDAVKEYGGWFGFESFGESNVDFWLFIQARNRLASFPLRTKLMQDLHRRLLDEGIVINYPVRALQFPPGWSPNGIPEDGKPDMAATQANRRRRRERRPAMRQDAPAFPQSINDGDDGDGPGAAAGLDGPDVR